MDVSNPKYRGKKDNALYSPADGKSTAGISNKTLSKFERVKLADLALPSINITEFPAHAMVTLKRQE